MSETVIKSDIAPDTKTENLYSLNIYTSTIKPKLKGDFHVDEIPF